MHKQNRIILGTAVIMMTLIWVGYFVFTTILDEHYMAAEPAYLMASVMIIAMCAGTWVTANNKFAFEEQIKMIPVPTEPTFRTWAAPVLWKLYQEIQVEKYYDFNDWLFRYMSHSWDERDVPTDIDDFIYGANNRQMVEELGFEGYVLRFANRKPDGDIEHLRIVISHEVEPRIHVQRGVSLGTGIQFVDWGQYPINLLSTDDTHRAIQLAPAFSIGKWR